MVQFQVQGNALRYSCLLMEKLISTTRMLEQVSFEQPFELGKIFGIPDRERNTVLQFCSSHT